MKTKGRKKTKKKTKRTGISRFVLVALASILCFALSAQVQAPAPAPDTGPKRSSASRAIEGTVLSSDGAPVPGAIVQIKDSKTLQVRSYIAQKDGRYQFWGLSNDVNYELRAMAGGMTSKTKTVSVFNSRSKVTLNLKLTKKFKP
jgi:carboxypeptidase family protein